jgi:hypothetical protein
MEEKLDAKALKTTSRRSSTTVQKKKMVEKIQGNQI